MWIIMLTVCIIMWETIVMSDITMHMASTYMHSVFERSRQ